MKATKQEPEKKFVPVILTLETQAEVDAIFAVLNYTTISNTIGLPNEWQALAEYRNIPNACAIHKSISKLLQS